jgi:hypothetical protein
MLDAHPRLAIPSGTFFIPDFLRACTLSSNPTETFLELLTTHWKWHDFHLDAGMLRQHVGAIVPFDLGEALRTFYRLYAGRFGKQRWGDKSAYLWKMEVVQQAIPEAAFIHLIRDGRDVALSIRPLHWGPNSIAEAAEWWKSGIEIARAQSPHLRRYLEIHFEELVAKPRGILLEVCKFIDLPFHSAMLDYPLGAEKRLGELVPVWDPNAGRLMTAEERRAIHSGVELPPQPSRVGRWRREMTDGDRRDFDRRAGALLHELGYASV